MRDDMTIKDLYGNEHDLSKLSVGVMIGAGWAFFIISWIINVGYYKFHPSSVEVFSLKDKKILYVFGMRLPGSEKTKKEENIQLLIAKVEGKIHIRKKKSYCKLFDCRGRQRTRERRGSTCYQ